MNWLSILISVLVFGFLIFVHELGHFIAARLFGITVYEFSIGMGPKLVWYDSKKSGIRYKICMIPFGGYVSMAGEGEDDSAPSDDPRALTNQKPWKRLIVMSAGGLVNVFVGFLLILVTVLFASQIGAPIIASYPEPPIVENGTQSVLMPGDEILKVDGNRIHTTMELDYEIARVGAEPVEVIVLRDADGDGTQEKVALTVAFPTVVSGKQVFGARDFNLTPVEKTVFTVMHESVFRSLYLVKMVWTTIFDLVTGRFGIEAVSGPVGITEAVSEIVSETKSFGILPLLRMIALISINLGVVNLLPLPALDGGRIVFVVWEMIFRKPISRRIEARIHAIGLFILLGFSVLVTFFDIKKLF